MLTAGDVYEVAVRSDYIGDKFLNVLHAQLLVNRSAVQLQADLLAFANAWKEVWRPSQSNGVAYERFDAHQVAGTDVSYSVVTCRLIGGDVYGAVLTGTLAGGVSGTDGLATYNNVAAIHRTGLRGRSRMGKSFIGGWTEGQVVTNTMASGTVTTLQTALDVFRGVYGSGGTNANLQWVVFSRFIASGCKYVNALPKPILTHVQAADPGASTSPVLTSTVSGTLVPMHRRKHGVGI